MKKAFWIGRDKRAEKKGSCSVVGSINKMKLNKDGMFDSSDCLFAFSRAEVSLFLKIVGLSIKKGEQKKIQIKELKGE